MSLGASRSYTEAAELGDDEEGDDINYDDIYDDWLEATTYDERCVTCKDKITAARFEAGYRTCAHCARTHSRKQ